MRDVLCILLYTTMTNKFWFEVDMDFVLHRASLFIFAVFSHKSVIIAIVTVYLIKKSLVKVHVLCYPK